MNTNERDERLRNHHGECPWCVAHPHREPCSPNCAAARFDKAQLDLARVQREAHSQHRDSKQEAPDRIFLKACHPASPNHNCTWSVSKTQDDSVEYVRADLVSRASVAAPEEDAAHAADCCAKYMCGEPVPKGAHECGNIPWCRRCPVCVADVGGASSPSSASPPCSRCADDDNYLPAYFDEEVKAWLHRDRDNEGYLCRAKHPNGFDRPVQPESEQYHEGFDDAARVSRVLNQVATADTPVIALRNASTLCRSGEGRPKVELWFSSLKDAQTVHKWLVQLVAATTSPPSETAVGGNAQETRHGRFSRAAIDKGTFPDHISADGTAYYSDGSVLRPNAPVPAVGDDEGETGACSGCVPVRAGVKSRCSIHGAAALRT